MSFIQCLGFDGKHAPAELGWVYGFLFLLEKESRGSPSFLEQAGEDLCIYEYRPNATSVKSLYFAIILVTIQRYRKVNKVRRLAMACFSYGHHVFFIDFKVKILLSNPSLGL